MSTTTIEFKVKPEDELRKQADYLKHQAKTQFKYLLGIPEGASNGQAEKFVEYLVEASVLESLLRLKSLV